MNYKILGEIDHTVLLQSYEAIRDLIKWDESPYKYKQTGLQYAGNEDPFLSATGSIKNKDYGNEQDYNKINPLFCNTVFEDIIKEHKLTRTRLMWIYGRTTYSVHQDPSWRLHVPIVTNPECVFLFPEESKLVHLPVGNIYSVDTTKPHTFCNLSADSRLHLVGCVNN